MDIRKVFGLNMRRVRLAAGLSQEAAAEIIGVGRGHASSMERGQQNVTLLILWQVAQAFGCRAADLLDEAAARAFAASLTGTKAPRRRRRVSR
ncbi:MAG TPA: helix-turn-helix transcriptional regulator [Rhizomicrobium sp.]|jgi:transcriptional regulator with XRE-family HTH domain